MIEVKCKWYDVKGERYSGDVEEILAFLGVELLASRAWLFPIGYTRIDYQMSSTKIMIEVKCKWYDVKGERYSGNVKEILEWKCKGDLGFPKCWITRVMCMYLFPFSL